MTKEKTIHQNNLESFAKETYSFSIGLSLPIMYDAFIIRSNRYILSNFQCLYSTIKRTAKYKTETVTCRGPQHGT